MWLKFTFEIYIVCVFVCDFVGLFRRGGNDGNVCVDVMKVCWGVGRAADWDGSTIWNQTWREANSLRTKMKQLSSFIHLWEIGQSLTLINDSVLCFFLLFYWSVFLRKVKYELYDYIYFLPSKIRLLLQSASVMILISFKLMYLRTFFEK